MYLSFYSQDLDQNQITDLPHSSGSAAAFVDPRRPARGHLGRSGIRDANLAQAGQSWLRLNLTPAGGPRGASGEQLSCRRRQDEGGSMIAVNLVR